jgi:SAM-dependent methyltransferase
MNQMTVVKLLKPKLFRHHSTGICPVCGKRTIFLVTDKLELIRNHAICIRCRSVSRHRAIALCTLKEFSGENINALSDFSKNMNLKVFNTSNSSPIAKKLGKSENIYNTEYYDDCPTGQYKNGVMCQDLENLAFDSDSFDLVITEDVLEHVRDVQKGFQEIYRILKSGGVHIYSIPFFFDCRTKNLFEKRGEDYVPVVYPIEYHGDSIRGQIPAFYHLGYDMFELLDEIGFETKVHFSKYQEYSKYGTFDCYTFVSRKAYETTVPKYTSA